MACVPSKDSDQPGHLPSLVRVFAVCMKKAWILSYPLSRQWRHWSDLADAQADRLRWAHSHFVSFFMRQLIWYFRIRIRGRGTKRKTETTEIESKYHGSAYCPLAGVLLMKSWVDFQRLYCIIDLKGNQNGATPNPYKPSILFLGHMQTVQTQIRRHRTRRLIKIFTVC